MEGGEDGGFPFGDGVVGRGMEAGEGGRRREYGVDEVPDTWRADTAEGGEDPWQEGAAAGETPTISSRSSTPAFALNSLPQARGQDGVVCEHVD